MFTIKRLWAVCYLEDLNVWCVLTQVIEETSVENQPCAASLKIQLTTHTAVVLDRFENRDLRGVGIQSSEQSLLKTAIFNVSYDRFV